MLYIFLPPHFEVECKVVIFSPFFFFAFMLHAEEYSHLKNHVPENQPALWPLGCAAPLTVTSPQSLHQHDLGANCAHFGHFHDSTEVLLCQSITEQPRGTRVYTWLYKW